MTLGTPMLAHIGGLPVEEALLYAAPVAGLWLAAAAAQLRRLCVRLLTARHEDAAQQAAGVSPASESTIER